MKKLDIKLQPWHYGCADGCCSDSGTNVYVDGVRITEGGDIDHELIRALCAHLGYECSISGIDEKGEEVWTV